MTRSTFFLLLLVLAGCSVQSADSDLGDEMPEDFPEGACRDTDVGATSGGVTDGLEDCDAATTTGLPTTSGTTGQVDSQCAGEDDCDGAGACVAQWDQGERGPFQCQFACIPSVDETTWCSDDASCCDAEATCTQRGYCVVVGATGDGSTTGG